MKSPFFPLQLRMVWGEVLQLSLELRCCFLLLGLSFFPFIEGESMGKTTTYQLLKRFVVK